MHLDKQQLIQVIKDALRQQHEGPATSCSGSPYLWDESDDMIGIDGHVNLGQLADTIIEADIAEYRKPLR